MYPPACRVWLKSGHFRVDAEAMDDAMINPQLATLVVAIVLVMACLSTLAARIQREMSLLELRLETLRLRNRHVAQIEARRIAAEAASRKAA